MRRLTSSIWGTKHWTPGLREEGLGAWAPGLREEGLGSHPGLEQPLPLRHSLLQEPLHAGDVWVECPIARRREERPGQVTAALPLSPHLRAFSLMSHLFPEPQFSS